MSLQDVPNYRQNQFTKKFKALKKTATQPRFRTVESLINNTLGKDSKTKY